MKRLFSVLLIIFILLIAIAVGSQNDGLITINYLLAQATMRVSTFIAIALAGGILLGIALLLPAYLHVRWQLISLRQKRTQQQSSS